MKTIKIVVGGLPTGNDSGAGPVAIDKTIEVFKSLRQVPPACKLVRFLLL